MCHTPETSAAGTTSVITQGVRPWVSHSDLGSFIRKSRTSISPETILAVPIKQKVRVCGSNTAGYTAGMSKVMVSLPDELLALIDAEAKRRSTSRSALLALAAQRELRRRDSAEIAEAIARSELRFMGSGDFESADL